MIPAKGLQQYPAHCDRTNVFSQFYKKGDTMAFFSPGHLLTREEIAVKIFISKEGHFDIWEYFCN